VTGGEFELEKVRIGRAIDKWCLRARACLGDPLASGTRERMSCNSSSCRSAGWGDEQCVTRQCRAMHFNNYSLEWRCESRVVKENMRLDF